ncbi:MAG: hypothetical protein LQ340_005293 [Diploschistes diacapsis]|nr:MAG: hypothetical protein LQ340_005293 [Diploschistes diacapsis]
MVEKRKASTETQAKGPKSAKKSKDVALGCKGIWATCDRGREKRANAELLDLLNEFAIRITIRNHSTLEREGVIAKVAQVVGPRHSVNLDSPDTVIMIEIFKNVCAMAVVGGDYGKLKKYNLAELTRVANGVGGVSKDQQST